ncbi:3692_t:CDS:2 [Entrophospora sp. SA101]|nr:3692_t:CDS:2 [Entrophospora sp. SA101]
MPLVTYGCHSRNDKIASIRYNLDDPTTPTTTATLQKTKADDVEVEMDNKGKLVAILILLLMLVIEWSLRKQQRSIPEQKIILFMQ